MEIDIYNRMNWCFVVSAKFSGMLVGFTRVKKIHEMARAPKEKSSIKSFVECNMKVPYRFFTSTKKSQQTCHLKSNNS